MSSLSGLGSLVQDIAEEGNSQTHDSTYEANNSKLKIQGVPLILKAEHFILLGEHVLSFVISIHPERLKKCFDAIVKKFPYS